MDTVTRAWGSQSPLYILGSHCNRPWGKMETIRWHILSILDCYEILLAQV